MLDDQCQLRGQGATRELGDFVWSAPCHGLAGSALGHTVTTTVSCEA